MVLIETKKQTILIFTCRVRTKKGVAFKMRASCKPNNGFEFQ